jgi:lipopolysaccharide assembly protein A
MSDTTPPPAQGPDQSVPDDSSAGMAGQPGSVGQREPVPAAHTRISASWTASVLAVVILVVLVIFIAENTQRSTVNFLGFHGHAPTAVTLLIAAIAGAAVVVIAGVARIVQLRKAARRPNRQTSASRPSHARRGRHREPA